MGHGGGSFERIVPQRVGELLPSRKSLTTSTDPGTMRPALRAVPHLYECDTGKCVFRTSQAPLAQLDRASDYGSEGWEFESLRARVGEAASSE